MVRLVIVRSNLEHRDNMAQEGAYDEDCPLDDTASTVTGASDRSFKTRSATGSNSSGRTYRWARLCFCFSSYFYFTTVDICFVLSGLISTVRSFQKCNQNRTVLKFWYRIRYSRYIFNDFIFLIKTSNSDFSIPLLEGDLYSAFFGSFCIRICMRSTCPLFQVAVRKTNNKFE